MDEKIVKISVSFVIVAILFSVMMPIIASNDLRIITTNRNLGVTNMVNGGVIQNSSIASLSLNSTNTNVTFLADSPDFSNDYDNHTIFISFICSNDSLITEFLYDSQVVYFNSIGVPIETFEGYYNLSDFIDVNTTEENFPITVTIALNSTIAQSVTLRCIMRDVTYLFDGDSTIATLYSVLLPLIILIGSVIAIAVYKKEN